VLTDGASGALGAVGAGASVGVGAATAVVCVAVVAVSGAVTAVSVSGSLIVPPRPFSTMWLQISVVASLKAERPRQRASYGPLAIGVNSLGRTPR
jgi:hypothetical protein